RRGAVVRDAPGSIPALALHAGSVVSRRSRPFVTRADVTVRWPSMDTTDETFELFRLPDPDNHPATIADRLLDLPEHAHLRDGEARIDWLMRVHPKFKGGRIVLGTASMPRVNGELSELFDWMLERLLGRMPDFLIVLDLSYWEAATPLQREIICYHELCHCVQKVDRYGAPRFTREGLPVWGLREHDV